MPPPLRASAPAMALTVVPLSRNTESPSCIEPDAGLCDGLLGVRVRPLTAGELALDRRLQGQRPAVRALQQPLGLQDPEVLADRRLGDAELRSQLADARAPAHGHQLGDLGLPLVSEHRIVAVAFECHRVPSLPLDRISGSACFGSFANMASVAAPRMPAVLPSRARRIGASGRTAGMLTASA